MSVICLTIVLAIHCWNHVNGALQAYEGDEPSNNVSPIFSVTLTQQNSNLNNGVTQTVLHPHVYYSAVDNTLLPNNINQIYKDRSVSWIEFGQQKDDTTNVKVDIIANNNEYKFLNSIRILPVSYDIQVNVISETSVSFDIKSNYKHLSVEFNYEDVSEINSNSANDFTSFKHSMLVFVGDFDSGVPKYASTLAATNSQNVLYFEAGAHSILNGTAKCETNDKTCNRTAILTIESNSNIDTIYFERGAWVYGKINVLKKNFNILGYGVLDGSYFSYSDRNKNHNDGQYSINCGENCNINGITCYNPSNLCIGALSSYSKVNGYRMIGWYYNNDGIGLSSNSIINNSFIRTNDDSIKISYGDNIIVSNNVIWQLFNGASFQLGWNGNGCENCIIENNDVIKAEWHGYSSSNNVINPNDAVIGMHYTLGKSEANFKNIKFNNIRIDTSVGRVFGLLMQNELGCEVYNIFVNNLEVRQKLMWMIGTTVETEQFIYVNTSNGKTYVYGVYFDNVKVNGKKIMSDDDWNLQQIGPNGAISHVEYS